MLILFPDTVFLQKRGEFLPITFFIYFDSFTPS